MDKKSFISLINHEDKNLLSNLYDKIKLSEKIMKPVYVSEFYSPNIWRTIQELEKNFDTKVFVNGIFEECERRMMAFSKEEIHDYPFKLLKIENKSKFNKLEHRDYLGAMIGLGIKREKFGDLILSENSCYAAVCEDVSDYIIYNLDFVGKCPCKVEVLENFSTENIKVNGEEVIVFTTSYRLDCIVSSLCNLSRNKAVELIQGGKILVNYVETSEKDDVVKTDNIITIRGYGKFKIVEQVGSTQKGRFRLLVKKYI